MRESRYLWFLSWPRGRRTADERCGIRQQQADDLLWIRGPFLNGPHGLPYTVVHGHTFRSDYRITRLPHRIGIDTGAFKSGQLTALPLAPWPALEVAA